MSKHFLFIWYELVFDKYLLENSNIYTSEHKRMHIVKITICMIIICMMYYVYNNMSDVHLV